ncbi:putative immune-type receptor 14b isoform X1 [Silurus meridionalis]|nr:putative immune-type receptor 14b isoform X1 [Silurus meridionalis]
MTQSDALCTGLRQSDALCAGLRWSNALCGDTVQSGRYCISAQSLKEIDVYHPETKLSVDIGHSAHLQCCVIGKDDGEIIWFRQQNGNQPRVIVRVPKTANATFYHEFQNSHFQIKRLGNCFNLTISHSTVSDEATYYCAFMFAAGTRLQIKGDRVTTTSVTSKPTLHEDNMSMNTQEKTVNTSVKDSPGMQQEFEDDTLNYAALQFSKRKVKAGRRKPDSVDEYQARKYQVTADSPKQPEVCLFQKELSVNIGESATLHCCVSNNLQNGRIIWLKQRPNQTRPEVVAGTFTGEFQSSRLQIENQGNCYNLTIFNTTKSDNSIYYCALMYSNKISLKIKGINRCDSVLIDNASVEDSPGTKKESEEETLNYAAVNFSKTKAEAENKHISSTERWVSAQSLTESLVYQPDKELTVDIGDSATLRCCFSEKEFGMMALFKQSARKQPRLVIKLFQTSRETFYNAIQESRVRIERSTNCFNLTISSTIQSDESMYYCALLISHDPTFGDGTYLKINDTVEAGRRLYRDTAQFLTETPVYQPHKVILVDIGDSATLQCCIFKQQTGIVAWFKQTNSKKTKIIVKFFKNDGEILDTRTGSQVSRIQIESSSNCFNMTILHTIQSDKATYYCVLLTTTKPVFSNRTYLKIKVKTLIENAAESRQESEAETMNYAALKFSKTNTKSGNRKSGSFDQSVYSSVYFIESGGRWVSAESLTKSPVYQPDKELSVDIGDSATLRCCISEKQYGMVTWFKQPTRKKPQTIVRSFVTAGDTFNDGFNESHFQIERSTNCINLSILNTFQSDEATYYCAVTRPNIVFAEGTYLKINGRISTKSF